MSAVSLIFRTLLLAAFSTLALAQAPQLKPAAPAYEPQSGQEGKDGADPDRVCWCARPRVDLVPQLVARHSPVP